jgi:hypothetical protein
MKLKSSQFLVPVLAVLPLLGCRTTENASKVKNLDYNFENKNVPGLTCDKAGAIANFMTLKPVAKLPVFDDIGFPVKSDSTVTAPADNRNIRLGLCVLDESVELKNVVIFDTDGSSAVLDVVPASKIAGLYEMYYGEEYAGLDIQIPYESVSFMGGRKSPSTDVLYIKGNDKAGGASYVTVGIDEDKVQSVSPGTTVVFGKFAQSQGTVVNKCSGKDPIEGSFTIGTAKIDWKGCTGGFGTSGDIRESWHEVTITDSSKDLAAANRGKAFTLDLTSDEAKTRYIRPGAHHGTCDSFSIKFDHATYGVTSDVASTGWEPSCEKPAAGALPRAKGQDAGSLLYRIAYGTKVVTGKKPCEWHFLQCKDAGTASRK